MNEYRHRDETDLLSFRLYFYYICFMTKNETISHINLSLKHLNVSKIILFGSYANDTQSADSDIDLLVVTDDDFVNRTIC